MNGAATDRGQHGSGGVLSIRDMQCGRAGDGHVEISGGIEDADAHQGGLVAFDPGQGDGGLGGRRYGTPADGGFDDRYARRDIIGDAVRHRL